MCISSVHIYMIRVRVLLFASKNTVLDKTPDLVYGKNILI